MPVLVVSFQVPVMCTVLLSPPWFVSMLMISMSCMVQCVIVFVLCCPCGSPYYELKVAVLCVPIVVCMFMCVILCTMPVVCCRCILCSCVVHCFFVHMVSSVCPFHMLCCVCRIVLSVCVSGVCECVGCVCGCAFRSLLCV